MNSFFEKTKPKETLLRYDKAFSAFLSNFMADNPEMVEVHCPFCEGEAFFEAFILENCRYLRCKTCESLYNSPRLSKKELNNFYSKQPIENFYSESLPSLRERRIQFIMQPRWNILSNKLINNGVTFPVDKVMEVGAGIGYFIEVMQKDNAARRYVAVEPAKASHPYLQCLPNTDIVSTVLEEAPADICCESNLIFLNSVIEHPFSLKSFFDKISHYLKPEGIVAIVDMHSGGFDIEILKGEAQNVNPHLILQIGSIEGLRQLGKLHNLDLIDTFSMGEMDIDILYSYSRNLPLNHPLSGFSRLLEKSALRKDIQAVLKKHLATGYNGYILQKNLK
jgi:hypothetical protein